MIEKAVVIDEPNSSRSAPFFYDKTFDRRFFAVRFARDD